MMIMNQQEKNEPINVPDDSHFTARLSPASGLQCLRTGKISTLMMQIQKSKFTRSSNSDLIVLEVLSHKLNYFL